MRQCMQSTWVHGEPPIMAADNGSVGGSNSSSNYGVYENIKDAH